MKHEVIPGILRLIQYLKVGEKTLESRKATQSILFYDFFFLQVDEQALQTCPTPVRSSYMAGNQGIFCVLK